MSVTDKALREAAAVMEEAFNAYTNPESVRWDPKFCTGEPPDLDELAEAIIKERNAPNGEG